jgi:hypothetical protein
VEQAALATTNPLPALAQVSTNIVPAAFAIVQLTDTVELMGGTVVGFGSHAVIPLPDGIARHK